MSYLRVSIVVLLAIGGVSWPFELAPIIPNDNRLAAGFLRDDGVLVLNLRAGVGEWRPEGPSGRRIRIEAFGEDGRSLAVPAPLIRVPEGTEIIAVVRNDLTHALRVHGLCDRLAGCKPADINPGRSVELRFRSGPPGTYTYWATTTGAPQQFRGADDTQLSGAFVVDPKDAPPGDDRIFVITEWTSLTREQLRSVAADENPGAAFLKLRPDVFFSINGRVWPSTERVRARLGEPVRWRVINLSTQVHPMHLHGFYFDVDSLGDGMVDRPHLADRKPRVVTQVLGPGMTMGMTWTPERAGNWLFHCHVMTHVSPVLHVDGTPKTPDVHHDHARDAGLGMTGMVLGVVVDGPAASEVSTVESRPVRQLTMVMQEEAERFGSAPGFAISLNGTKPSIPGPPLVLTRGEPVAISVVNRLPESTAIHWHGMELESYYDGVHGFGGRGQRVTPMIEPGDTFVVRFTPPRAGSFIYHTHVHDKRQLTSGLYGAMLVVEPGQTFDPQVDHALVIGRGGPHVDAPAVVNGMSDPQFGWAAGTTHRLRLINITPDDIVFVTLQGSDGPVMWKPIAKDGAPVSAGATTVAAKQMIAVGETYDFEYVAPPGRRTLWLEVRTAGGKWLLQARAVVK